MALILFMAVIGALAGLGIWQIWYPMAAIGTAITVALLLGAATNVTHNSAANIMLVAAAMVVALVTFVLYLFYQASVEKLAPQRALKARSESFHAANLQGKARNDPEFIAWKQRTADEWWRKYPGPYGISD